jgi:hypothetical protein
MKLNIRDKVAYTQSLLFMHYVWFEEEINTDWGCLEFCGESGGKIKGMQIILGVFYNG